MKLKKKVSLLELSKIKEKAPLYHNYKQDSSRPKAFLSSSRFTSTQMNKTEPNTGRTEDLEFESLLKLRNNLKKKLLVCKDTVTEAIMSNCFKKINTRIAKLANNQIPHTLSHNSSTNRVSVKPDTDGQPTTMTHRNEQEESNRPLFKYVVSKELVSNNDVKKEEKHHRLFKQMTQLEKINKEIVLLDLQANDNFLQDHPKYYFIREKVLRRQKPTAFMSSKLNKANKGLNLTVNPYISNIKRKGNPSKVMSMKSQSLKSHKALFNEQASMIKANAHKRKEKPKLFNQNDCFPSSKGGMHQSHKFRPFTATNTRKNSLIAMKMITQASDIISDMKEIGNSIQGQYYFQSKGKYKPEEDYHDNHLLDLYHKKEETKQKDSVKSSIKIAKKEVNNTMERGMITTLSSIPSPAKNTFREAFKKILNEHRLLNKPTEYVANPYEQRKMIRRMNCEFHLSTKKKLLLLQSVNENNISREVEELNKPPKDNKFININELEWLLIKKRVLKADKNNKKPKPSQHHSTQ